jgi:hypothetical protein
VRGTIWREERAAAGALPGIHQQQMSIEAVLGTNLRQPARVTVAVDNAGQVALPLRAVELAMRQRRLCFVAQPKRQYLLAYGAEDIGGGAVVVRRPAVIDVNAAGSAALGLEMRNPSFRVRSPGRATLAGHPAVFWLLVAICVVLLGVAIVGSAKPQRREH